MPPSHVVWAVKCGCSSTQTSRRPTSMRLDSPDVTVDISKVACYLLRSLEGAVCSQSRQIRSHNIRGDIGCGPLKLRLKSLENFSACHEGVYQEGVARETIMSQPLTLSYLQCLCIRYLDPLHNTRYSHLHQKCF